MFYPAIEAVSALASALIIWYGGATVLRNALTLGALVAFLQYSQRFFRPISDMSEKFNVLQAAMASSERIFKLLDEPVAIESPPLPARRPAPAQGHIVFDGVWFTYNEGSDETWVLKGISFDVRPGERVGIVGATGSGKTTLINLLLRFYDVKRGRITIDGVDIRRLDLADVRGLFSLVLQDVHLFSGTIADNIRFGRPDATDEQVRETATAIGVDRVAGRFADGLDHVVREGGAGLSAGERQLISIARALLADPRILILDEATSNIDRPAEVLIEHALDRLLRGRTSIIIAHRLSTVRRADEILVVEHGRIVQRGTERELLAEDGPFLRLARDMSMIPATRAAAG